MNTLRPASPSKAAPSIKPFMVLLCFLFVVVVVRFLFVCCCFFVVVFLLSHQFIGKQKTLLTLKSVTKQ